MKNQVQCLPVSTLEKLEGKSIDVQSAMLLANHPILQRWVGVQYHPETEYQSHYGEMRVGKCYDLIVFCDKSQALSIDISARPKVADQLVVEEMQQETAKTVQSVPQPQQTQGTTLEKATSALSNSSTSTAASSSSSANANPELAKIQTKVAGAAGEVSKNVAAQPVNKRLLTEFRRILRTPIEFIEARPLETNLLEWHFVITGTQDPYVGGKYHGILEFPDDFPMKPPSIKMLTPSGRFEINKRICLSMSDFHKESWNPAWTIEKILIGLMSYMYEENNESVGSLLESKEDRRKYAQASSYFNAQNEIYVELFHSVEEEEQQQAVADLKKRWRCGSDEKDDEPEKVCRYCLVDTGELVNPCSCRGSSQWVHKQCLRQWQRSVLVTQSTHPRYQIWIAKMSWSSGSF